MILYLGFQAQTQLLVKVAGQPTAAPLSRPAKLQILQPNLNNILVVDLNATILGKQRQGPRCSGPILEDFDGLAPGSALGIIDLTEVEHLTLDHTPAGHPTVLNHIPVAVLLAVLLSLRAA